MVTATHNKQVLSKRSRQAWLAADWLLITHKQKEDAKESKTIALHMRMTTAESIGPVTTVFNLQRLTLIFAVVRASKIVLNYLAQAKHVHRSHCEMRHQYEPTL